MPDEKNFALTPLLRAATDFTNGPHGVLWRDTNGLARLDAVSVYRGSKSASDDPVFGNLEKGTFTELTRWAEFYRGNTNYPQAAAALATPAETILVALGQFNPELTELRAAATSRPGCRFPAQLWRGTPLGHPAATPGPA